MGFPSTQTSPQLAASRTSNLSEESRRTLSAIAASHGFSPKRRLHQFSIPPKPDFIPIHERDATYRYARDYLIGLKLQSTNGKTPTKSVKDRFWSSKRKSSDGDPTQWTFDANELADALDEIISGILVTTDATDKENQLRLAQAVIDNEQTEVSIRRWTI